MDNFTVRSFPGWLRNSNRYEPLYKGLKGNLVIPLTSHLPETEFIDLLNWEEDFIRVFNASNEWSLKSYPISIYLFTLIKEDRVFELLDELNNTYSRIFLNELSMYLLKYRHDIYNYAELNYGIEFIENNPVITELKNTPHYEIKYEFEKDNVEAYVTNDINKTDEVISVETLSIRMIIFKNGIQEVTIGYMGHINDEETYGLHFSVKLVETFMKSFYINDKEYYKNIYLSDTDIFMGKGFFNLEKLKETIENHKKYKLEGSIIWPFKISGNYLCVEFGKPEDIVLLDLNRFNEEMFLKSLANINYSDTILRTEIFENEILRNSFHKKDGYKAVKLDRKITEIPFTIRY